MIDAHGIEALTMRRLAAALGVDPMAIYRHLRDKQAVLAGVVNQVFAELQIAPPPDPSWQAQVRAFAEAYRALARRHPHLVFYVVTSGAAAAGAVLVASETLYAALEQAGLPLPAVVQAADTLVDYLNGFALAESSGQLAGPEAQRAFVARLAELPPEAAPTLRRVFAAVGDISADAGFDAGLALLLAGIEAGLPPRPG
jgi:AcrR family transcriptional regulator